jgi:hypothetical protein
LGNTAGGDTINKDVAANTSSSASFDPNIVRKASENLGTTSTPIQPQLTYLQQLRNNPNISSGPNNWIPFALIGLLGVTFLVIVAIGIENSTSTQSPAPTTSYDSSAVEIENQLTALEASSSRARLVCESQPMLDKANSLNIVNDAVLEGRRQALIKSLGQKISALNVAGKDKYVENESCTYGWQWFDSHGDDHWRVFIALSEKCNSPALQYSILAPSEDKVLSSESISLSGHISGEVKIPYPTLESRARLDQVSCS